jgi:insertion element IS1 protein InsB
VNHGVLAFLHPAQVEVEIWRADELEVRRGLSSELDEMWSFVQAKAHPRWLWHAIDHHTGKVLAYVFGRRKDAVFLKLAPCGRTIRLARRTPWYPHDIRDIPPWA